MAFDKGAFVKKVRDYMKDFSKKNRLLDNDVESSDMDIEMSITLAILECNTIEPMTLAIFNETSFDDNTILLILPGVVANILESESFLQARNQLNYSDGGGTVSASDKQPVYSQIVMYQRELLKSRIAPYKRNMAFEEGFGGHNSAYALMSYYPSLGR